MPKTPPDKNWNKFRGLKARVQKFKLFAEIFGLIILDWQRTIVDVENKIIIKGLMYRLSPLEGEEGCWSV